jgi:hypothetical protein
MFSDRQIAGVYRSALLFLLLVVLYGNTYAQGLIIKGHVTDAANKPVSYVSVFIPNSSIGTSTDDDGYYQLRIDSNAYSKVQFSFLGFKTATRAITAAPLQVINVKLEEDTKSLNEVVVKSGKKKRYRNKNNPAVDLIRLVIDNKSKNEIGHYNYVEYNKYEKIELSLSNTAEKLRNNRLFKKYTFITNNLDTTSLDGRALMPIYLQENISDVYYRKDPEKKKEVMTGDKKMTFSDFIDNQGLTSYIKHIYQDVDIYQDNITVVTNQFLSPIANLSPDFYRFYITDTITENGQKLVRLFFSPRNKTDFLFQGTIYITLDGNYTVEKVDMAVNKNINLNWVRDLHIVQNFEKLGDGRYAMTKSVLSADFGITKNSSGGIYGKRTVSFKDYTINKPEPDSLYKGATLVTEAQAEDRPDSFWTTARHDTLTTAEANVYTNIDSMQRTKSFKRTADLVTLVLAGYKKAGPYVEIGPVNTFYDFNPVEGFRLRFGGRTTPFLSKKIYFESYAAYGFKDERWKYYLGTTYSLSGRSIYEFPVQAIHANYQQDTKIPGQELQFIQEDNFLLSFKRGVNDKWLYNKIFNIDYLHEFSNHFSYKVSFKNWLQQSAGGLDYEKELPGGQTQQVSGITTSEVALTLRWAPKEEFYQGKLYRVPIYNKYPIITLLTTFGIKGIVNSQYNYQNVILNLYKHFYLSQLGYTDVVLEGGYIFNQLPYPLLDIPRANQSYSYQLNSYNMMNFLEFISDHYASLNIDHCFNGFFLNKIPLIKKLKFREYVDVKALYGGLRNENNPGMNPGLLKFPTDASGNPTTFIMGNKPYVEGSIGVGNIFKLFRIDVIKRLTYLNLPNVSPIGIRGRFKFDF